MRDQQIQLQHEQAETQDYHGLQGNSDESLWPAPSLTGSYHQGQRLVHQVRLTEQVMKTDPKLINISQKLKKKHLSWNSHRENKHSLHSILIQTHNITSKPITTEQENYLFPLKSSLDKCKKSIVPCEDGSSNQIVRINCRTPCGISTTYTMVWQLKIMGISWKISVSKWMESRQYQFYKERREDTSNSDIKNKCYWDLK